MLKNDYIMRKIEEWISMILEFVFKIDKSSSPEKLLKLEESKEVLKDLKSKIDIGNINEAEDSLFDVETQNSRQLVNWSPFLFISKWKRLKIFKWTWFWKRWNKNGNKRLIKRI